MSETVEDRPVVFQTRATPRPSARRRPVRVLVAITMLLTALAASAGLAFGGSAVWSVVGPKEPTEEPGLWIQEPPRVGNPLEPDADQHGADRPPAAATSEPGASHRDGGKGGAPTTSPAGHTDTAEAPDDGSDDQSTGGSGDRKGGGSGSSAGGSGRH
jgi:uncharacterized membrane protein YgcG